MPKLTYLTMAGMLLATAAPAADRVFTTTTADGERQTITMQEDAPPQGDHAITITIYNNAAPPPVAAAPATTIYTRPLPIAPATGQVILSRDPSLPTVTQLEVYCGWTQAQAESGQLNLATLTSSERFWFNVWWSINYTHTACDLIAAS